MLFFNEFQKEKLPYEKINLVFNKKITKLDRIFLNMIYSNYQAVKKDNIILSINQIMKLCNFDSITELCDYLNKISGKKIEYNILNKDNSSINGSFPIVSSYFLENNSLFIFLSKEMLLSLEANNFFNYLDIFGIINFENNYSLTIFLEIINSKQLQEQGELTWELKDFKTLLSIDNLYDRFYDLERKVIKSIISDFNNNSRYRINIEKIKEGNSHSHKILGVKLSYTDKILETSKSNVNNLIFKTRDKINDFNFVYNLILDYLKLKNYDYVKSNVNYALKNHKKENFDSYLAKTLKENYHSNYKEDGTYNQIISELNISSTYNLYMEISNILNKVGLKEVTEDVNFHSLFYRTIYKLSDKKVYKLEYTYNSLLITITVEYFVDYKSIITIKKENVF